MPGAAYTEVEKRERPSTRRAVEKKEKKNSRTSFL
jgi:hypothetical protein